MLIGAHVSTQGGLMQGLVKASEIGAESIQIFTSAPQRWARRNITEEEVLKFTQTSKATLKGPVFIHAPYLINLCSPNENYQLSIKTLKEELITAGRIKALGVIVHIGSYKANGLNSSYEYVLSALRNLLKDISPNTNLILENATGKTKMGNHPSQLGYIIKKVNHPNLKICIDTQHAFASGCDFRSISTWGIPIKDIIVLHVNDSKTEFSSFRDRHENIGEGFIGKSGFTNLIKSQSFENIPWILETPGFANKGPDKQNISILRSFC